jgi:Carboxypeptidase regulatory-like domain
MKRYAGALVVALLLIGIQGCNSDQLPPAAGYASVNGLVVDARTNAPISGAVITIDTVLTATTDSSGKFSIDKVPSGITDYGVQAKGYQPFTSSTNVEPGKPFQLNVTLAQQPPQ